MKVVASAFLLVLLFVAAFAHPAALADEKSPIVAALQAAVDRNLDLAQSWLDDGDYKSLRKTISGLELLVEVLHRKGSAAEWSRACEKLDDAMRQLASAAKVENKSDCRKSLAHCRTQAAALAKVVPGDAPSVQGLPVANSPAGSSSAREAPLPPLMALLDGTFTDAKSAVAKGKIENGKRQAIVLAELADLLSNYHQDAQWQELARGLKASAHGVVETKETDPTAVRQLLRGVYQRCETCHEARRP